jgi:integrase
MTVAEAVAFYLSWRAVPHAPAVPGRPRKARFICDTTLDDYDQKSKPLAKFFGDRKLADIRPEHFSDYQVARLTAHGYTRFYGAREVASPAGPIKINAELAFLKRLMKMGGCWTGELEMYYEPFQEDDPETQRALDLDQQEHFLRTAASNPRWHPVWWYALAALHLNFSSDEMRTLRFGDINLAYQTASVNPSYGKNRVRRRTNTIEDGACLWALQQIMQRAGELCASNEKYKGPQPHYFLWPRRVRKNLYDPERPMGETGLRKIFEEVRAAAELPWFPFNGFRHTSLTRLAELGAPEHLMERRAGHIGRKMMRRYVQIGEQAQRLMLRETLSRKPPQSVRDGQRQQRFSGS